MDPDLKDRLERVDALQAALRDGRPRPDKMAAWYCASALLDADGAPEDVAVNVRGEREAIVEQIGKSRAPTGEMRWAYAAVLVARGVGAASLVAHRDAIRETWRSADAYRKTGRPHAGGARAALVLSACGLDPDAGARAFFDMKVRLNPPCWRRDPGVTDLYCAAHAAKGDDPRIVDQARERAVAVFSEDGRAKGHKHAGAKACALFEAEPRTVLRRFHGLDDKRKEIKGLRHRITRDMAMEWAAQGLEPADMDAIAALMEALPKALRGASTGRSRMAHLLLTHGRDGAEFGEITALAAVIAAQTAAVVAVMAATTATTTAATTGS